MEICILQLLLLSLCVFSECVLRTSKVLRAFAQVYPELGHSVLYGIE